MATGPFEKVDPKLTIFALANGMDLVKDDPSERVLSWYREGRERAIVISSREADSLTLSAAAWATNHGGNRTEKEIRQIPTDELTGSLSKILDEVIEAANHL